MESYQFLAPPIMMTVPLNNDEPPVALFPPADSPLDQESPVNFLPHTYARFSEGQLPAELLTLDALVFEGLSYDKFSDRCQEIVNLVQGARLKHLKVDASFYQMMSLHPEDLTAFLDSLFRKITSESLTVGSAVWDTTFSVDAFRSMSEIHSTLKSLHLFGGRLQHTRQINTLCSSVEKLTLQKLSLDVSCCLQDYPIAYRCLDVLLDSIDVTQIEHLSLGAVSTSASPLISVDGLERFLQRIQESPSNHLSQLTLQGLNLTDAHIQVLCREVQRKSSLHIDLLDQPYLTPQAYDELYHCINMVEGFPCIQVDDAQRNSQFALARKMNQYGRQMFISKDASFPCKEAWVEWMARLANCRDDPNNAMFFTSFEDLSAIFLMVQENIEMLQL